MPKLLCCFIFHVFSLLIYGQKDKGSNSLLWRITGNRLTQPSYLYGTIHVTDKRAFFLGDSIYHAIDKTEGFAAELDMNRVGGQMINYLINERNEKRATEPVYIKNIITPGIWEKYKEQLERKIGKSADKITIEDLDDIGSALETELIQKGEMPTFLDAHLFGIAKRKGKWVGGIEDLSDQIEHIGNEDIEEKIQVALYDEDYYRKSFEWFLKIYTNQLLDSIDAMYRAEQGEKDPIMIKRNLKMARRMDSLSAIRSTFFAVGAAHLPGDSGVISLLRSRGFTVTPVFSSQKIDPAKYILKQNETTWYPVEIKDSIYQLSMPGVAGTIEMLKSYGLDMKMFFDISFFKMYMTMHLEVGDERKKIGIDSLYNSFRLQFARNSTEAKESTITVNGIQGREYHIKIDEGDMLMQIFIPEMENVILNAVFALKKGTISDPESKKFFQSFAYNKNYKRSAPDELKWTIFTNNTLAFSIDFPGKPVEMRDVRSEEGKINQVYQVFDLKEQIFYGLKISSVKEGMRFSGGDSAFFLSIASALATQFENTKTIDSAFIEITGFPAYHFRLSGSKDGAQVEFDYLTIVRGNRVYYLFGVYNPSVFARQKVNKFIESFKMLPLRYTAWQQIESPDRSFVTTSPFSYKIVDPSEDRNIERLIVFDSLASHTIYIDKTILPSWFWCSSDTGFLRTRSASFKSTEDSIIDYRLSNAGDLKMVDFVVMTAGQSTIKKVKIIINGNELYEIYGVLAGQDLRENYHRFFDDFKILKHSKPIDLTISKINELAKSIANADKKVIQEIKYWWYGISLQKNDLALLQPLLLKLYPDFDSSYYNNFNRKLLYSVAELSDTAEMLAFIRNNYKSIQPENEYVKPFLISWLTKQQTKESFRLVKELLISSSYNIKGPAYFPYWLYDSLELSATLFPEILNLADNESLVQLICGLTVSLMDREMISKTGLTRYESRFITLAKKMLEKDKDEIEATASSHLDIIDILGSFNTPAANNLLVRFSKFSDRSLRYHVLIAMLKNRQPVDNRTIYTFATTEEYRYQLYEDLKKMNKLNLFPAEYLTQEKLAYSKISSVAKAEELPIAINNAGSKIINYKGKMQKFYLYKVPQSLDYFVDKHYYLGVAGPYSIDPKNYSSSHEATGIFWDKEFDEKKLDLLLKEYLDILEKEETKEDK